MFGRKFAKKSIIHEFLRAVFFISSVAVLYVFLPRNCGASVISSEEVWKSAEHLGLQYNIDPLLIFSIACAESSLDANADSGKARGIMQMTPDAWAEVTDRSFNEAWDWRENMEEAVCYLQLLKSRLLAEGGYSWPVMAAAYHYGLGKIEQADYDLARLPQTKNLIYAQIFKGETPDDLPYPAPKRPIEDSPQAFRPDMNLLMALDPSNYPGIPPLLNDSGEPISEGEVEAQGEKIVLPELDKSAARPENESTETRSKGVVSQDGKGTISTSAQDPEVPVGAGDEAAAQRSEAGSGSTSEK